jgi:hypothetical protein
MSNACSCTIAPRWSNTGKIRDIASQKPAVRSCVSCCKRVNRSASVGRKGAAAICSAVGSAAAVAMMAGVASLRVRLRVPKY